ncbi:hypothetical protein BDN71DRAFT_1164495 [Pleurotus eryngii]|uniref:Uncharacterized protein n=1 Tax=Pleurotus eryngii TaxID=5323 RepID=A0A9P5ZV80_PLEER|nr:hypothetical protein BDN71DRAFT_1164495 [Pleurotus eryngii]
MIGSVNSETALRPDLLSSKAKSRRATRSHGMRRFWRAPIQCLFAASEHRVFVPIFCLNHAQGDFRLCFFHRGGLLATTSMYIQTEPGFRQFVSTIVGLWQWDTLDMRRPCHTLTLASITCNIVLTPFSAVAWPSVTSVFAVKLFQTVNTSKNSDGIQTRRQIRGPNYVYHPEVTTSLLQELKDAQESSESWYFLDPLNDLEPSPPQATKQLVSGLQLPDTFIVKCSHQSQGRNKEEEVFRSVQGFVGIPDILAGYDATLRFRIPLEHIPAEWNIMQQDEDDYDG